MGWVAGAMIGANLLSGLLKSQGEKRRRKAVQASQLQALKPLEAQLATGQYGLSSSEGLMTRRVTQQTLGDLASRGVIDSSIAAPEVASAVAPIQAQHEERNQAMTKYIAASKMAIAGEEPAPGYEEAFGGTLGDIGGLLAMMQGRKEARMDREAETNDFIRMLEEARKKRQMGKNSGYDSYNTGGYDPDASGNYYSEPGGG